MNRWIDRFFRSGQRTGFLLLFLIIFTVSMLTSFFPLWANVPLHVVVPIVILLTLPMVMFEKLKLSTLVIMRALVVLVLFHGLSSDLYISIVLVFLIINILEATFTDLLKNKMYFNFVTGLFLAASVFCLGSIWLSDVTGPYSGLYLTYITQKGGVFQLSNIKFAASLAWIVAYTLWNWIFVIGEFSPSIGYLHLGILASPIVSCLVLGDPGYWLLMRANSLTAGGIIQIASKESLEKNLANPGLTRFIAKVKSRNVQLGLMILNLALIAWSIIAYFS